MVSKPDSRGSIEVRIFIVPATGDHANIQFARVNHTKYMVTDNTAFIGTKFFAIPKKISYSITSIY